MVEESRRVEGVILDVVEITLLSQWDGKCLTTDTKSCVGMATKLVA